MTKALRTSLALAFFVAVCFIVLPIGSANDSGKGANAVTFNRHVAPIIYKHCAECHRPGELAPMSLLTFKDARPWARSIREKVVTRQMPPWHADANYGHFSNDTRLSQQEVDTITAWVDSGAKEGNAKDLPRLPEFTTGWKIGKPDIVLTMPEEYTVEATGPDEYINFAIPTNFKEDTWVQAAEINPGNKRVVHHVIGFVQSPQMQAMAKSSQLRPNPQSIFYKDGTLIRAKMEAPVYDDGCGAPNGGFARGSGQEGLGLPLCFYTPGKDVDVWPEGTAKLIPAGSNIVIQMHYSKATGKAEKDRTSVGLIVAKKPPEKMMMSFGVINHYFKIPPGADNHEVKGCYTFSRDTELLTYLPHMHVRGKDMKYEVIYPDGRRDTLLYVPRYDFNWQTMYRLEKPVALPKGTRMIVTAHFDNSEKNKYNPDPTKEVRFGDPTYDEMMIGYFDFVSPAPKRPATTVNPKIYDAYVGDYQIMPGAAVKITREGDKLMAGATSQPSFEIFPESETKFFFKVVDAQITFVKNEKGDVTELIVETNGRSIRAKKIIKPAADGTDK
jgi:hypothetical protein